MAILSSGVTDAQEHGFQTPLLLLFDITVTSTPAEHILWARPKGSPSWEHMLQATLGPVPVGGAPTAPVYLLCLLGKAWGFLC